VAIYYFVQAGNRAEDRDAVKNWSEEVVKAKYDEHVNVALNNVTYWEGQIAAAPDETTKKSATESLERAREEHAKRLEQDAESYHEDTLKGYNRRVRNSYVSALWCLIWIVLYIIAERPCGYMLSKRRTEMKVYSGLRGALFGIAGAFVGVAGALQVTEYITTYSDGTKSRSSDAMPILFMKLGLLAAAVLLVLFVARIVIVIATIMGFIRNYDLVTLSKQAFDKGKELTAKKETA
jgi:lipid-A-disaccharide synthase-like uncharacterized protein